MNILVTGAKGFLGRSLVEALKNVRDGKDRTRPQLTIESIYEYDLDSTPEDLDRFCGDCGFVFHLAGVNRTQDPEEFARGNVGALETLLEALERAGNRAPVMLSGSVQASLTGRFGASAYGRSKRAAEELLFGEAEKTGRQAFVYRFPNLAGKWIRPNYNSAVATFCYNVARDLPVRVDDPSTELELLFTGDLLRELLDALEGHPHRCRYPAAGETIGEKEYDGLTPLPDPDGPYCFAPVTHRATLGRIVSCLQVFRAQPETLVMPYAEPGSFESKLHSMYVSFLPPERAAFEPVMRADERGSFTELIRTAGHGQFSVNVSKPGVTKGRHWHKSKWEIFVVVSGRGLIRERRIGTDEIYEYEVGGDRMRAVYMLPGYTHEIVNLSDTDDLVTLMWASEAFDPARPDTYYEPVGPDGDRREGGD